MKIKFSKLYVPKGIWDFGFNIGYAKPESGITIGLSLFKLQLSCLIFK